MMMEGGANFSETCAVDNSLFGVIACLLACIRLTGLTGSRDLQPE
jgi:hypothetical protein